MVVTAAVVQRAGAYLVTRRSEGSHLAGCWEFPGGKCEAGESHEACLSREMLEELGAAIAVGRELLTVAHEYPERLVELHFYECELLSEPEPLLGQEMRWVPRAELPALEFPAADDELLKLLLRD